uniref:Integron gene cassette protein n=1 Tax=Rhabditophanes sp. KR3021 TaxID=114890 RepID=A0AC35UF74_9BILA
MTKTSLVLALLCFVVSTSATYTDDIARNVMMPMSGAAYSDTAQSCVKNVFKQGSLVKQVTASCDYDKNDMCSGFIAMDKETKVIVIAFRGSQGFFQLVQEGTSEIFGKPTAFLGGGVFGFLITLSN